MSDRLQSSSIWHPYTRRSILDDMGVPVMVRGEGPYLYDETGRQYVDAISSWWCSSLGHCHPAVMDAIRSQTEQLDHCILGNQAHPGAIELAERLSDMMPTSSHVHFASDGSCAVEAALKISVQYQHIQGCPEKVRFASLKEAYHGDTLAAVALGFLDQYHSPFAGALMRAQQLHVPPYDLDIAGAIQKAESFFKEHGSSLAACIIEPICQGTAGIRMIPAEFFQALQQLCQAHHVLLIADEIATGFFRTGKRFAFEHANLSPDITCLGKALTSGTLPISAAVVRDEIYDVFTDREVDHTFYHGHTFAGNPLGCAAALATLTEYEMPNFLTLREAGANVLAERVQAWQTAFPHHSPRCLGHIVAVQQPGSPENGAKQARTIQSKLLDQGILIRPLGPVTYIMPPLNTPIDVLEDVLNRWETLL